MFKTYECRSEQELREVMEKYVDDSERIETAVRHEMAHFNKAIELGYAPIMHFSPHGEKFSLTFEAPNASKKDLLEIVSAPLDLSVSDLRVIARLKEEIGENL